MRWLLPLLLSLCACRAPGPSQPEAAGKVRLVFVHQPLGGDPRAFADLLDGFRREHPEVELETQLLPNASDVAHQYFVTALEGGATELDVLVADVVWVPEFARAGWLSDLSESFPPDQLRVDFLSGAAEAVTVDQKSFAVPWYVDVGLLYYRRDLILRAPQSYEELVSFAAEARRADPTLQGYLWQGRQYEGLVCNVYERIWGFGGDSLDGGRLPLQTQSAARALASLRSLVATGVSPASVTSAAEEETRRAFQAGRAVFMRNWPYAWRELNGPDSPVRGKVAFAPLPSSTAGDPGPGVLGGWQLALSAHSRGPRREAALKLLRYLTSEEVNVAMALSYGRNPARRSAYQAASLKAHGPFVVALLPLLERARPRPVTPYYGMISDILQGEFSAAVSGLRSPEDALARAQAQVDRVMGAPP